MAGQGVERREILRAMAMAAAASSFPGFHRWAFACEHVGATGVQVRPASYSPQFFTADEAKGIRASVGGLRGEVEHDGD